MESRFVMDALERRAEEKSAAVGVIKDYLDLMEARGREPDHWERVFMIEAINDLFRGAYRLATFSAIMAKTPAAEQSHSPMLQTGGVYDTANVDRLRHALEAAEAEPLRPSPHFGPIVFTQMGSG